VKIVLATVVALVIAAGVAYRVVALGRVPGINGDETYYPVAAMNVRDGRPQPLVTGSGLPLNPLYVGPLYLLHLSHRRRRSHWCGCLRSRRVCWRWR